MIIVDREQMMAWVSGTLLDFKRGKGFAVNERQCEMANQEVQNGGTIGLTVDGRLVSTMKSDGESIVETPVKPGEYAQ